MSGLVIFSPSRFSLYTSTVTEMLIRRGKVIQAIFVRRLLNPSRFGSEYRRDGSRLIAKVWRKLFLRQAAYQGDGENIVRFRKRLGLSAERLSQISQTDTIPIISCNDLNDEKVLKGLENIKPDLVVFTGGGLIRQPVLDRAGNGVLNCHMGLLPEFRGMDVVEWPILMKRPDQVGISVHFMDRGVDTGDILSVKKIPPISGETIPQLRDRMEPAMCQFLVDTCCDFLDGKATRTPQSPTAGRQYFKMHATLNEIAQAKLRPVGNKTG